MVDWQRIDGQAPLYATCFIMALVLIVYGLRVLMENRWKEKTWQFGFWMQFLMTVRICATFYEEPIIIGPYGYGGFIALTCFNFFVVKYFDQYPIPSSFQQVEEFFYKDQEKSWHSLINIAGQFAGAIFSYFAAVFVWWITANRMAHHEKLLELEEICLWKFETTLIIPVIIQFFVGIIMRAVLVNNVTYRWPSLVPLIYSVYYAIVPAIFGFPGFEPVFSVARVLHCFMRDKHVNWFMWMLAYIIMPHLGWHLYRYCFSEKPRPSELKKFKKAQKEQDATELEGLQRQEEERRRIEKQEAAERKRTVAENRRREPEPVKPTQGRPAQSTAKRGGKTNRK